MVHASNPYIAGNPLRSKQGFFGRQDLLDWVPRELRNPQTNALVLRGQRRIGKTSLLLQLEQVLPGDAFLPVYFDLQDQAARKLDLVLADLADILAEKLDLETDEIEERDEQGDFFLKRILPQAYEIMPQGQRPVFLFDEFDVLDQATATELPETIAAKALLPFLRRLMAWDCRPAFVFVVGRFAEDLNVNFASTFKTSLAREIWVLSPESAEALVRHAESNGSLGFDDQAVARILNLTNGHPYLTQLLCQRLWEYAYQDNPEQAPIITVQDVNLVVPDALQAGDNALVWLWDGLSPAEKIYASALAATAGEQQTISEQRVIRTLTDHAFRLRTREVEMAPQDLIKRHVLEKAEGQGYRFAIELFRRWIQQYRPLAQVKDELDRVEPVANIYFDLGKKMANQHKYGDAIDHFRNALVSNPRHFRARVELGEMLLQIQQVAEAVKELEEAYKLDQEEARQPLARALVLWIQELNATGNEDKTLEVCERALQVSSREQKPKDIRFAIWTQRGDRARERGELDDAMEAYKKAGNEEGVVRVLKIQQRIELEKQAETFEEDQQWVRAAGVYQQLLAGAEQESLKQKWQTALARVEAQLTFTWIRGGETSWSPNFVLDERYMIVGQLADTIRYEIYLAKELQYPHERVVIKRLKPDQVQKEDALHRFEREVAFLRHLHHPSIQSLYDSKVVGEERYLVTEFADQKSLKDYLERQPGHKLSPMEALTIALSVGQGLEATHRQEIIHRDIKPGNILLFSQPDKSRLAKLADFGIARGPADWGGEALTEYGTWVGTAMYAAPEQLETDSVDARADLYSWGLVLFEMLTGEIPTASLKDPLTYEPTTDEFSLAFLSERGISSQLGTVLQKALQQDRKARYQSAGEVCRALEAVRSRVVSSISQHLQQGERCIEDQGWTDAGLKFEQGLEICREWYGDLERLYGQSRELVHRLRMGRYCAQGMADLNSRSWQAAIESLEALNKLDPGYQDLDIPGKLRRAHAGLEFGDKFRRLLELRGQENWEQVSLQANELSSRYAEVAGEQAVAEIRQVAQFAQGMVCLDKKDWQSAIVALEPLAGDILGSWNVDLSGALGQARLGVQFINEYQHILALKKSEEWEPVPALVEKLMHDYPGTPTEEQAENLQALNAFAQAVKQLKERSWPQVAESLVALEENLGVDRLELDVEILLTQARTGAEFEREYQILLELATQSAWTDVGSLVQALEGDYPNIPSEDQAAEIHNLGRYAQGQILLGQSQFLSAYEMLYNLYEKDPKYRDIAELCVDIAFRLGTENEREDDWMHCIPWLERVLSIDQDHGDGSTRQRLDSARYHWAEELRRTDKRAMVEQLEQISPHYSEYQEIYQALVNTYYQLLRDGKYSVTPMRNGQAEAEARYRLGIELWGKGDLQAASSLLMDINPQTPEWKTARMNLIEICFLLGKQELAQEHWQNARRWWDQVLQTATSLDQDEYDRTYSMLVNEYRQALRENRYMPARWANVHIDADARFLVAQELEAQGELEAAAQQLEAIRPQASRFGEASAYRYEIYCRLGIRERKRWHFSGALEWFLKAKALKEHSDGS